MKNLNNIQWLNEIYEHLTTKVIATRNSKESPILIGISGSQGSGKTTITKRLESLCQNELGLKVVSMSLDDFYLPYQDQLKLTERNSKYSGNKLLQYRGLPGTHSLDLLSDVLRSLKSEAINRDSFVLIPRYDKSLNEGRGDRLPQDKWTRVNLPVDLIILEGWFVGFECLSTEHISRLFEHHQDTPTTSLHSSGENLWPSHPKDHILQVNMNLHMYEPIWSLLEHIYLAIPEFLDYVYEWRLEQEVALQKSLSLSGQERGSLTHSQVRDFVDRFMPMYELYLNDKWIESRDPTRFTCWRMDRERNVHKI